MTKTLSIRVWPPLASAFAAIALTLCGSAQADIVNVGGNITGCTNSGECGGAHIPPGTHMGSPLINPAQITLGPGNYTITNGAGLAGANPSYTAWNYNLGAANAWIWSFMAIDDGTRNVLVEACCSAGYSTQAEAAGSAYALNYSATFTLGATTTIDFITEDYFPNDNGGGVALSITAQDAPTNNVPEPGTSSLVLAGAGLAGWAGRRRRQRQG
jgi:hypothetical protein